MTFFVFSRISICFHCFQLLVAREISISKADLSLSDVADLLDGDWQRLGKELGMTPKELQDIESEIGKENERGLAMLNNWLRRTRTPFPGMTWRGRCRKSEEVTSSISVLQTLKRLPIQRIKQLHWHA